MLGWLGFILAIVGCIFNAKRSLWCWPIWLSSNACWITYAIPANQWALIAMEITFVTTNVYGWVKWSSDD